MKNSKSLKKQNVLGRTFRKCLYLLKRKQCTAYGVTSLAVFFVASLPVMAQVENPTQRFVDVVIEPAPIQEIKANLVPLFWKANVNDSIVSLPLRNIEFFGIQDYVVDGATRVRELTISNQSRNLVRVYHIRPLTTVKRATNTIQTIRNLAEGRTDGDEKRPVKVFPDTTHSQMLEYRVENKQSIDKLYKHLESTMLEYHARTLTPEQRAQTVREVTVAE